MFVTDRWRQVLVAADLARVSWLYMADFSHWRWCVVIWFLFSAELPSVGRSAAVEVLIHEDIQTPISPAVYGKLCLCVAKMGVGQQVDPCMYMYDCIYHAFMYCRVGWSCFDQWNNFSLALKFNENTQIKPAVLLYPPSLTKHWFLCVDFVNL